MGRSNRFAVRTNDVADSMNNPAKIGVIERTMQACYEIELIYFNRKNIFALRYAVRRKAVFSGAEWNAAGKGTSQSESR